MPYLEESDHASDNVFLDTETSLDPHASPSQHITLSPHPQIQLLHPVLQNHLYNHLHQREVLEGQR